MKNKMNVETLVLKFGEIIEIFSIYSNLSRRVTNPRIECLTFHAASITRGDLCLASRPEISIQLTMPFWL